MTKRFTIRIMSLVLCMAMMFTCLQASATALTLEDVQQAFNKLAHYTVNELPKSLRSHLNSGWSRTILDSNDAERENVLTTVDADGTKTLYSYDSPIKYVDDEGYVRFIDSSLKSCIKADGLFDWYSYENTSNDIKTYFPLFIGTGVLVESKQGNIRMTPKDARLSMSSKVEDGKNEYVLYENVFDKNIHIRYTAINEGVKEDIILNAYNGNNTFEYIVEAEGLTPVRNAGKTVEFYDGNLQTAYTLGEIVLFDSADMPATNSNNSYTVEEIDDGKYLVTLIIDEEFLTDENTVYPVIIDPSVSTNRANTQTFVGMSYLKNNSTGDSYTEDSDYSYYVGYNSYTGYDAITYLRLNDISNFVHINPANIETATLSLNILSDIPSDFTLTLNSYNFDGAPSYADWNYDVAQYYAEYVDTSRADILHRTLSVSSTNATLNIFNEFTQWLTAQTKYYSKENTLHCEDGLIITSSTDRESRIAFASSTHLTASVRPSITVTYTEDTSLESGYYYIQSGYYYDDARYMTATSTGAELRDRNYADPNQIWYVKRVDEVYGQNVGMYYIYSVGTAKNDYLKSSGSSTIEWREESSVPAGLGDGTCFYIVEQTEQYHRVLTAGKKAVAAKDYNKENGTLIVQEKVKGLDNQRWEFEPAGYGVFAKGDTNISGVVGENVPFHYSIAPIDADYSIDIVNQNVAKLVPNAHDRSHAYVNCKAVGSTDITVSFTTKNPITGLDEPYSCTWHLSVGLQTISLDKHTVSVDVNDNFELNTSTNNNSANIVWSSSDSSIVRSVGNGKFVADNNGICTVRASSSTNAEIYDECEVWVRGKTPVFLIHGRTSNSKDTWGIVTNLSSINNEFDVGYDDKVNSYGLSYIEIESQKIRTFVNNNGDTDDDGSEDDEDKPRNLGNELVDAGYTANVNLFAFNYPNKDVVWRNAFKFDKYITNLITYVRNYDLDEMKTCFYKSKQDYINDNFCFNIVGHSMGGLVARYYIENLGKDENVDKLITIGTPHWGSGYANLSNSTGLSHVLCDHDLDMNSIMFGGTDNSYETCGCSMLGSRPTGELAYYQPRHTKYYAIAGVDYNATYLNDNNFAFEMPTTFLTYQEISDYMNDKDLYKLLVIEDDTIVPINPIIVGDNMVGFMSQIGWTEDDAASPTKRIEMEEIFVLVDTNGGNGGEVFIWEVVVSGNVGKNILHSKTNHREVVCNKVSEYLRM